MNWIFVGMLAGSLVTSTHDTKEACEGRKVTLSEKGVLGQCVQQSGCSISPAASGIVVCSVGTGLIR